MKNLPKIQLRNGFSDRNKIREENKTIQYKDFDIRTRTAICNTLYESFIDIAQTIGHHKGYDSRVDFEQTIARLVLETVYSMQVNKLKQYYINEFFENFCFRTIREDSFDAILDLIEFFAVMDKILAHNISFNSGKTPYKSRMNAVFEYDFVGYRFVEDKIIEITDNNEIITIEEAINKNPHRKCKDHFEKALALLSDRAITDYSNSIKESISAVECICQIIVGKNATLGEALKLLEKRGVMLPGTLKTAFDKMYGYTSNEGGIRHANAFSEVIPDFADAKFMLVVCSAFVNYLIAKQSITGNIN